MNDASPSLVLPVIPLRETVMFPATVMSYSVARTFSIQAIEAANSSRDKQIFLIAQKNSGIDSPAAEDLYPVGTVCKILQKLTLPDGKLKILCEGLYRARLHELHAGDVPAALLEKLSEETGEPVEQAALVRAAQKALKKFAAENSGISEETVLSILAITEPGALADAITTHMRLDYHKKQTILELIATDKRLEKVLELLETELALADLEKKIRERVREQMERNQREYYLTEQIRAINRELGRENDQQAEAAELEKRIKSRYLPEDIRARALSEVRKLRSMPVTAAEYTIISSYVEWILDLPWKDVKETDIDMARARKILDNEHYGLAKAKEHILEYLAVQKLSGAVRGPILCFLGPPGVGKTSLARSIAKATGRDFVRLSLGGVKDEAEIRGHRRTYVGALPGKIIQSLKRVRSNNPLFCLDEIDKLASDYHGDPAAALLEVLDPEQNSTFMDHYLDLEYDLSSIFFITTANSIHTIPLPLLDRLEIIELPSYLETEKLHIAQNYLLPRLLEQNGLQDADVTVSENGLLALIRHYTHESGVRGLRRELATICRKVAMRLAEGKNEAINVTAENLEKFLGLPKYRHEKKEDKPGIGVCAGLACNQFGGEIILVETSVMNGSGNIVTTGQLGEVMKESAAAAMSYVRSRASVLGLAADFYRKIDIHVHVPSGATPKDGPSAGITLATSIASALLDIPVRNDVAMTGEISLRGRVLPVGGLREKLLAAVRGGMKKVIVPRANEDDLHDVPQEILKNLELVLAEHVDEVLPHALAAPHAKIFSGNAEKGKKSPV